jgi:hypothetical protein
MPPAEHTLFNNITSKVREQKVTEPPKTLAQRLEFGGKRMYVGRGWKVRLATGLGVSRTMLWHYLSGAQPDRDIAGELVDLIERERVASTERGVSLGKLRNQMLGFIGRSNKEVA